MSDVKSINVFAPNQFDNIYYKAPIVGNRAPTNNDRKNISTVWIDTTTDVIYINSSINSGTPNWVNMREVPFTYFKPLNVAAALNITLNAIVGSIILTGQVTASGAQATVALTNSFIGAATSLMVTVSNGGANDARMTLERVYPQAGSVDIMLQNNGAAALNGDINISFWIVG